MEADSGGKAKHPFVAIATALMSSADVAIKANEAARSNGQLASDLNRIYSLVLYDMYQVVEKPSAQLKLNLNPQPLQGSLKKPRMRADLARLYERVLDSQVRLERARSGARSASAIQRAILERTQ